MRRPRVVSALAVGAFVAAVTVVALAGARVSAEATEASRPAAIDWSPCPGDATAQCGTVAVPVDWADPGGPTFTLALARRPATDPSARIGALLTNPGGPGAAGREWIINQAGPFSDGIRRRFDLIGVDMRGTGLSNPVLCSTALLDEEPSFLLSSQADFDARATYDRRLRADCRKRTGPVFDHLDALSVVRDMDYVRAALGERRLSFYGVSYGSLYAQQYAELFPDRVRAIVADSTMDHSLGTAGFLNTAAASAQDSFDEFVAWSDRTANSPLHGQDVRAVWRRLLDRAARGDLPSPRDPSRPMPTNELINLAFGSFYPPDWAHLATTMSKLDTGTPEPGNPGGRPPEPEVTAAPTVPIFCSDWSLPIRDYREFAGHLDRLAGIAPDMRFSPAALVLTVSCLGWPGQVANPQHPLRVHGSATPLLLVNAKHDPATGYTWATAAAHQLGREAVLLTYDGWGHGTYGRGDCVNDAVDRYLVTTATPAAGAHCAAVEPAPPVAKLTAPAAAPAFPY